MALPALIKTLQKEFDKKIVTAERMDDRRCFGVDRSLDHSVEVGKPIVWHNLKDLSQKGYAVILYNGSLHGTETVGATVVDEINSLRVTQSPNASIQEGPTSFRDIYDSIAAKYPVIVGGKPL